MNQKEFDTCWDTIRTALTTGQHSQAKTDARTALSKLEAVCRFDRCALEARSAIAPPEHFEYAARRLRMWLEFARNYGDLLLQLNPRERKWLNAEIERTAKPVDVQRGRVAPKSLMSMLDTEVQRTTAEPIVCECCVSDVCPLHGVSDR